MQVSWHIWFNNWSFLSYRFYIASFNVCMFVYQIFQCRKLLYEMSGLTEDQDPPVMKPDGWKKACASVLALTVSCDYKYIPECKIRA